jgi:hypothetical protein
MPFPMTTTRFFFLESAFVAYREVRRTRGEEDEEQALKDSTYSLEVDERRRAM